MVIPNYTLTFRTVAFLAAFSTFMNGCCKKIVNFLGVVCDILQKKLPS